MTNEDDDELTKLLAAQRAFKQADEYAARGQRFSGLSEEEIRAQWIIAFKLWVANWGANRTNRDNQANLIDRCDLEAEMLLRHMQPPYSAVQAEGEILKAKIWALTNDPRTKEDILDRLEKSLEEDFNEVFGSSKSKN